MENLVSRIMYTSSPVDSRTFYDLRSIFCLPKLIKQILTWIFDGFFFKNGGFGTGNRLATDAKSPTRCMLIITQVKTTLRMKFRKENLLFGDQNYRFPQPGVTVGQQSFKALVSRNSGA